MKLLTLSIVLTLFFTFSVLLILDVKQKTPPTSEQVKQEIEIFKTCMITKEHTSGGDDVRECTLSAKKIIEGI
jgi:hypothetical protein